MLGVFVGLVTAAVGGIAAAAYADHEEAVREWEEGQREKRKDRRLGRKDKREDRVLQAERDREKAREAEEQEKAERMAANAVRCRRYRYLVDCKVVLTLQNPEAELVGVVTGVGRRGLRLRWIVDGKPHGFTWEHIKKITLAPPEEASEESEFDPDAI